jgi:WxL interacting protein linking bacterial and host surfaces
LIGLEAAREFNGFIGGEINMHTVVSRVLRIVACSLAILGSATPRALADSPLSPTGTLSAGPEADQPADMIGKGYFQLTMAGGQQQSVRLMVTNTNTQPMTVRAYPVDGVPTAGGGVDFNTFEKPVVGAGTWVSVDSPTLELAPGETRRLTATVAVAPDATPGDHVAGIAVEDMRISQSGTGSPLVINVHYRRALAVVVTVPGERTAALEVDSVAFARDVRGVRAVVQVRNTGNILLKAKGTVEVSGDQAMGKAQAFSVETLIPSTGTGVLVPMPNVTLAPGTYNAHILVQAEDGRALADWQGRAGFMLPAVEPAAVPDGDVSLAPVDAPAPAAAAVAVISDQDGATISRQASMTNSVGYWVLAILGLVLVGRLVLVRRRKRPAQSDPSSSAQPAI